MQRPYPAVRLLEHGPLTRAQMREITGWPDADVSETLVALKAAGLLRRIRRLGCRRPLYQLREGARA